MNEKPLNSSSIYLQYKPVEFFEGECRITFLWEDQSAHTQLMNMEMLSLSSFLKIPWRSQDWEGWDVWINLKPSLLKQCCFLFWFTSCGCVGTSAHYQRWPYFHSLNRSAVSAFIWGSCCLVTWLFGFLNSEGLLLKPAAGWMPLHILLGHWGISGLSPPPASEVLFSHLSLWCSCPSHSH